MRINTYTCHKIELTIVQVGSRCTSLQEAILVESRVETPKVLPRFSKMSKKALYNNSCKRKKHAKAD